VSGMEFAGRQAREIAWSHYHYARHVQGLSKIEILRSIGIKPDPGEKITPIVVLLALEQAWVAMQLGKRKK